MKYKALICDVDGTTVQYGTYGSEPEPTPRVVNALRKASEKIHVCLASGRSYYRLQDLIQKIDMEGLVIANDGAIVSDLKTGEMLYEKGMLANDFEFSFSLMKHLPKIYLAYAHENIVPRKSSNDSYPPAIQIFTEEILSKREAEELVSKLSIRSSVKAYMYNAVSRTNYGVAVSHAEATKLHALVIAQKHWEISREETIGVGDSYNDFGLLMGSGLKVAMGNALPVLKDIADFIAPPVEEDGLATVIEKFVLSSA